MRYAIKISRRLGFLFSLFGFSAKRSYVELTGGELLVEFGPTRERVPLAEISGVARRGWPWYYGLGPKLGPAGGVSYVGSADGVVQIDLARPRPLRVWGPFRAARARCLIVSLEAADQFIADLGAAQKRGGLGG